MNNLKIINTNESIKEETEIFNLKYTKEIYKSPVLYKLGSVVKKTAGSGGDYIDAFSATPNYDPS